MKKAAWFLIILVFVGGVVWLIKTPGKTSRRVSDPEALPGIQTSYAPWFAEITHLSARLRAIGLPLLSVEGTALHTHQHLDIFIDGKQTPVPANIGIDQMTGLVSPVHVHDNTNVIHVESPTVQVFTLGQFFDIWGVKFTKDSIGGYIVSDGKNLKVYSNGTLYADDPRGLELTPHQEIVIVYGTDADVPKSIPSSYDFPPGE